uniref:Uncharacterized protein n=1 Tax=Podoviridae sp. ctG4L18 TaxID=2825234 RepID=A0A8S5UNU3_9CAUD|nr:MAG TPA: hypothetical protein [Podoviridae sp. ctG4L18]
MVVVLCKLIIVSSYTANNIIISKLCYSIS